MHTVPAAFFLPDFHDGAERIRAVSRKGTGIKTDFPDKIGVNHADNSTGRALRGKVVDYWDLDPIEVKNIF
ncbi:hypothetical protein SDC9_74240 [bioreactor metagenome]|uniref:Uncharacterized protein n=1 Tax=bioreactor metagenome TaxID=1076179 RepID=A0A644YHI1_9ZZZZ